MTYAFHTFELDADRLELRRAGQVVKADALVLRLLAVLVRSAGQLVTKDELVEHVWEGRAVADNVLTVSMARLRKTLDHVRGEREFVVNVYGRGYRFVEPVIERARVSSAPPPVAIDGAAGLPFVGRELVLGRLRQALGEARDGRGRLCVLTGEPGIGKTAAVEAFERELSNTQVRIAWGYCRQAGDTPPLWPFVRLLRELGATVPEVDIDPDSGLGKSEAIGGELASEGLGRHRGFDAMLRAFTGVAAAQPCVLVLDDLHRADAASLEFLALLLDEIARTRILVIATLRHAQGRRAPRPDTYLPYLLGHRNCERIALDRLRSEDVAAYVGALMEDGNGNLGRAVFDKSEGNPFFMAELSRQLRDAAKPDPDALAVPDTALDMIRQRVARLDPDTRDLLAAAAVIGRSFELPLLALVTEREPVALMAGLDQALASEVVVAAPDSMTAFAFGHELLRIVLYDALTPSQQRSWHVRIARALEQRINAGDAIPPSEPAYHFYAALPESDARTTVRFCRAAAAAAAAAFANPDVVRYTRRALEALDLVPGASPRLRMRLLNTITIYARGFAWTESLRAIREVIRLAREHGDARTLAGAACMLNAHPGFVPMPDCGAALRDALGLLTPADVGPRAMTLAVLACTAPDCYQKDRSQALIEEALAAARSSADPPVLRVALACKLYAEGGPAHDVRPVADELERLALQHPLRMRILPVELAMHRAQIALRSGDMSVMDAELKRAVMRARDLRHSELSWHSQRFLALSAVNTGAWSEGITSLAALHRQAEQQLIFGTRAFCAFDRVVVFGELTDTPSLDDALRNALEFDAADPPSLWSLKLRALAAAGLLGEARAALRALTPAELAQLPSDTSYLGTLGHLARAALALGALDYAEAIYPLLARHPECFAAQHSFLCEGAVPQLLGMLAHALGQRAAAIEQLERAVVMNDQAGLAPRAAEARLQLSRALSQSTRTDDRRRARTLAQQAHEGATRLAMPRLAREAGAELTRADGGSAGGPQS